MSFRFLGLSLLAIFFVAACNPLQIPYAPGTPISQLNADISYCYDQAEDIYPISIATFQGGGYSTPSNTSCYGSGYSVSCTTYGGNYVAPYTYQSDVNATKREIARNQCFKARGYAMKYVQECTGDVIGILESYRNSERSEIQEVLNSRSCWIEDPESGRVAIIADP